jgi:hypothetical protein
MRGTDVGLEPDCLVDARPHRERIERVRVLGGRVVEEDSPAAASYGRTIEPGAPTDEDTFEPPPGAAKVGLAVSAP